MTAPLLIVGATGAVGRGVVAAAVASGRPLVLAARNPQRLARLRAGHPRADIQLVPGSIATDARAAALAAAVQALGRPLAGVVVAVRGEVRRGRLVARPVADLGRSFDLNLHPHLHAARHLLPLLSAHGRGGSYVLLGGPGAERPWAGYGTWSISAAALQMLARVLHEEARSDEVRVQLLQVGRPVRDDASDGACPQWPTALAIGQRVLALIDRQAPAAATCAVVHFPDPAQDAAVPPPAARAGARADDPGAASLSNCQHDVRRFLQRLLSPDPHQENP